MTSPRDLEYQSWINFRSWAIFLRPTNSRLEGGMALEQPRAVFFSLHAHSSVFTFVRFSKSSSSMVPCTFLWLYNLLDDDCRGGVGNAPQNLSLLVLQSPYISCSFPCCFRLWLTLVFFSPLKELSNVVLI